MKALQDIVVLDLTRVLAGPYCTMMLADFGADVIKIEIPVKGDDTRGMGPFVNNSSLYYANVNRNKKSVTLNLKDPKGKELFLAMVKKADVVVENYRPGVMDKLGVGYDVLKEVNDRIIYAAVSGFGSYGRNSARPGYDIIAQAYQKPVIVKVAAVHNIAAIASGIARSGADIIAIDGFRGGTGAAPTRIRDNVGIPIELALAAVDQRLREEGIRNHVSLIAGGSIRSSADVVKAIALGADACYIGTAALLALGCHLCRSCQTGLCSWGITTQRPELVQRLNIDEGSRRLVNLMTAWRHEIKEMMGGMGINSVEALRGNRLMLRGVGLTDRELKILGISHAGE